MAAGMAHMEMEFDWDIYTFYYIRGNRECIIPEVSRRSGLFFVLFCCSWHLCYFYFWFFFSRVHLCVCVCVIIFYIYIFTFCYLSKCFWFSLFYFWNVSCFFTFMPRLRHIFCFSFHVCIGSNISQCHPQAPSPTGVPLPPLRPVGVPHQPVFSSSPLLDEELQPRPSGFGGRRRKVTWKWCLLYLWQIEYQYH